MVTSAVLLVGLLLTDGCRLGRDLQAEIGRLQGEWECVGLTRNGRPVPRGEWKGLRLVIAGRDWTASQPGNPSRSQNQAVTMDPRATPKRIEFRDRPGSLDGPSKIPGRYYWVYALDGDTLKASHNVSAGSYPARVDGGDEGQVGFEFRRAQKR